MVGIRTSQLQITVLLTTYYSLLTFFQPTRFFTYIAPLFNRITAMAKKETKSNLDFPFGKENLTWMFIGIGVIFIGFYLMIGGGSDDPKVFNPEIFSPRRITVAPVLVILGLAIEVYAIMKKSKD